MATGSGRASDPRSRARRAAAGSTSRGGARPAAGPRRASRPRQQATQAAAPRQRFTARAAVLVLVLALLMVSYASSMRAYLAQRHHIAQLSASIASSQAQVDRLSQEKKRWRDPAYVQRMAHQRFGWVLPGEIGFQVLDPDGRALARTDTLSAPDTVERASRPLWWQSAWGSVEAAGKPPVDKSSVPPPVTRIKPPTQPKG
jgi:cell division protein FtsB